MNTQKKFLKVLSMLTIILLIATIFIPGNGNRNAVASIGILGILLLFLSTLLPKIHKLTLNLLKNQGKTSPWSSLKSSEPVSETEELLWRQISYQITDKLQAAFPNATWEFQKQPSMKQLLCGNPIRLRTFHTEDYNFAEARMNQYGYLELQMLTIASLKKTVTVTDEDDVPFADPESWYTLIGRKNWRTLSDSSMRKDTINSILMKTGKFTSKMVIQRKSRIVLIISRHETIGIFSFPSSKKMN